MKRTMESKYMQWAKSNFPSSFNLATSGVHAYPWKDLQIDCNELEITPSGPGYGYQPLQHTLATKCNVQPENVVAATGTSMANHLAMAALIEPGDEVLIEQPTYDPILAVAGYLRAKVKRFPRRFENHFAIDPEEIRKNASASTRLIIITNFHNPSGVMTPLNVLTEVGKFADEIGARVLVDEVYLETLFGAPGSSSAFHISDAFVTTSSLTKAYGLSGLRCGWILAEAKLAQKIWHLNDLFAATAAHTAERLSVLALQKLPQIANRAKSLLEKNRELLKSFLADQSSLDAVLPEAGTIIFPRLKSGNADRFCTFLAERYQTRVVPGSFFEMPQYFRLGIGSPSDIVSEGLNRLKEALANF